MDWWTANRRTPPLRAKGSTLSSNIDWVWVFFMRTHRHETPIFVIENYLLGDGKSLIRDNPWIVLKVIIKFRFAGPKTLLPLVSKTSWKTWCAAEMLLYTKIPLVIYLLSDVQLCVLRSASMRQCASEQTKMEFECDFKQHSKIHGPWSRCVSGSRDRQ